MSLDFEGERSAALQELAKVSGWSVIAADIPEHERVSVHVRNLPADVVLEAIFDASHKTYEARRNGDLLVLREAAGDAGGPEVKEQAVVPVAKPIESTTALVPASDQKTNKKESNDGEEDGPDRAVKGGSLRIEKGERVHDVSVVGGSVDVFGVVTGDLVVVGGEANVREGAHVKGDALAVGGKLSIDKGGRVDGDTGVLGGILVRSEGAVIRGKVHRDGGEESDSFRGIEMHHDARPEPARTFGQRASDVVGHMFSLFAVLFVFGSVLLALRSDRMEALRCEAGLRPMRSFGLGVVGGVAFLAGLAILCVTIVGIPLAIVGAFVGAFSVYAGVVAVVGLFGELLLRHRTKNPYAHLALGTVLFVVVTQIPTVGTLLGFFTALVGIGAIVATRAAGTLAPRTGVANTPYRG